jgi:hypothetical protein
MLRTHTKNIRIMYQWRGSASEGHINRARPIILYKLFLAPFAVGKVRYVSR